jgi:hypothetical protein
MQLIVGGCIKRQQLRPKCWRQNGAAMSQNLRPGWFKINQYGVNSIE